MNKIEMNETYGYVDFISDEEKNSLLKWTFENEDKFYSNKIGEYGEGKKIGILHDIENSPLDIVDIIKKRIIEVENIKDWVLDPTFKDAIGINRKGGAIHQHTDPNLDGYTHVRYNVILQYPEEGGDSIYNGKINKLQENMVWRCVAGRVVHGSTPVVGNKTRITLTLGFQIKDTIKESKTLL
jgi:hypothetical protein